MSWWFRLFAFSFLLGGCLVFSRVVAAPSFELDKPYQYLGVLLMALFPLIGAGVSLYAFTSRIRFSETLLERETLWGGRKSMAFSSIRGRREFTESDAEGGSTRYVRLESNDGSPEFVFGKKLYGFRRRVLGLLSPASEP